MTLFQSGRLGSEQCLSLLGRARVGRVGLVLGPLPFIYPVRYEVERDHILFGVSFEQVATAVDDTVVALQADGFDEDQGWHWTVLAIGPATAVDGGAVGTERAFRLRPRMYSGHWLDPTGTPV
jgi:nitroimidazol reductase NimA-like FMN-containing flavoprotein (pyridoxamine 5'-phosphate oxidase superfamily)